MRLFFHQFRGEQRLFWRSKEAAIFVFILPILLFVLVGSLYGERIEGHPAGSVLLVGLLCYGVANTAFSGLAIALVVRREGGVLKRVRATPLPAPVYFAALLTSTIVTFAIQAVALIALGTLAYNADLPERPVAFAVALLVGTFAFAGVGLGTAALIRSGEGSSAVVNVILLPMAFLSGSFGPTRRYPEVLRAIGEGLPLKHLVEIVRAVTLAHGSLWRPVDFAVLLAWGVGGLLVATRRFKWEPQAA